MRAGGGFFGIHNVFGTEYNWPYYEGLVGNANYYDHGANQPGHVYLTGSADPSTQGLPADWQTTDEFYNMQPYPTNVKFLIRLDETTLAQRHGTHPGHGDFSPRAWCQNYDGGHVMVTSIGHDNNFYQRHLGLPRAGGVQEVRHARHQECDGGYRCCGWWYSTQYNFLSQVARLRPASNEKGPSGPFFMAKSEMKTAASVRGQIGGTDGGNKVLARVLGRNVLRCTGRRGAGRIMPIILRGLGCE